MLKEKLLSKYYNGYHIDEDRMTPLRRFVDSLGLDHKEMTRKQMDKWARTKRYKNFFRLMKIKRIADEANVSESVIFSNLDVFLSQFEVNMLEESIITEEEVLCFLAILEAINRPPRPPEIKIYKGRKRGKYKSLTQRKDILKNIILNTVGSGGISSLGAGGVMFAGTGGRGIHTKKSVGSNRLMVKRRIKTSTGSRFHRKVYQPPKGY